jgi:16S rRNA C1402 (ribose-2'-O) methylase RsmI
MRGSISTLLDELASRQVKGEIVLVVQGATAAPGADVDREAMVDEVLHLKETGLSLKEAVAVVVEEMGPGTSRSALYNAALERSRDASEGG